MEEILKFTQDNEKITLSYLLFKQTQNLTCKDKEKMTKIENAIPKYRNMEAWLTYA